MDSSKDAKFTQLFKDAARRCFHVELTEPLNENKSKLLSVEIEEKTGLVIGYKTLKNYSISVCAEQGPKKTNPSLSTLDTLARYVLKAPPITEAERLKSESHFPYWNRYRKNTPPSLKQPGKLKPAVGWYVGILLVIAILYFFIPYDKAETTFHDDFSLSDTESLQFGSWQLVSPDCLYWKRRSEHRDYLTLFTLESDNWPDSGRSPQIKNLLIKQVDAPCFTVEAHIEDFLPKQRWQQAGIILMGDTSFVAPTLRVSVAYNDFFGGYDSPPEIILQGIVTNNSHNPEEFLHHRLFQLSGESEEIVKENLRFCRLKIEKNNTEFRFLIAASPLPNAPYKEVGRYVSEIKPKYVGIFALKGRVKETAIIPLIFDSFDLKMEHCE